MALKYFLKTLIKGSILGTVGASLLMGVLFVQPVFAGDDNKCGLTSLPEPVEIEVWETENELDAISPILAGTQEEYWGQYAGRYYYNQLSTNERVIWDAYYSIAMDVFSNSDTISKTSYTYFGTSDRITKDELTTVRNLFYYANPQFYFLDGSISYSTANGYVSAVALGIASDFQKGTAREAATAQFKTKLDSWVELVNQGKYDEGKVKIAHDIIACNTVYNYNASNSQSAYSLVVNGQTVCAGYAGTLQLLLNAAGVETIEVTSPSHGWNMVKLHDVWYTVDVTWDDRDSVSCPVTYEYYNRSLTTLLNNDQDDSHAMQDWYDNLLPQAKYDSSTASMEYESAYFNEGDYTYFKVNDNNEIANRIAKVIDVSNDAKYQDAPEKVTYSGNEYEVQNPGAGSGSGEGGSGSGDSGSSVNGWVLENGKEYWYENGIKQGVKYNADGTINLSYRGKEIYDTDTDAWYWLDNVQGGAKTASKDVFQESAAGFCAMDSKTGTGKWVRYDADGHMVKGFDYVGGDIYYFDETYGTMVKGFYTIEGIECYFNKDTGKLELILEFPYNDGWNLSKNGNYYWFENYQRQGYSIDSNYRGKEIYDPDSDAWYWLDNVQDGAMTVSKDVYQESEAGDWGDIDNGDGTRSGKWVRYDSKGHMIKGWCAGKGADATAISNPSQAKGVDAYYFDYTYGTMAKGKAVIDGVSYEFDRATGVLVR